MLLSQIGPGLHSDNEVHLRSLHEKRRWVEEAFRIAGLPVEDPWRVRVWNPSKALPLVLTVTLPVLESSSPTNALGCAARQVAEIRAVGRQLGKAVAATTSWTPGPEDAPTTLAPGFRGPKGGESLDSCARSQKGLPTALPDIPLS